MSGSNKTLFLWLARINKMMLPSYIHADLNRLSTFQKMIIAYRYWVTKNCLD